jgi:hypothetical protein
VNESASQKCIQFYTSHDMLQNVSRNFSLLAARLFLIETEATRLLTYLIEVCNLANVREGSGNILRQIQVVSVSVDFHNAAAAIATMPYSNFYYGLQAVPITILDTPVAI